MKAKLLLVLAAAAMLFAACGKDKIYKNELTWNGDTREVTGSVSVEQQGTAYSRIRTSQTNGAVTSMEPLLRTPPSSRAVR